MSLPGHRPIRPGTASWHDRYAAAVGVTRNAASNPFVEDFASCYCLLIARFAIEGGLAMRGSIEVRRFESPDDALDMKDAGGIKIIGMASTGATGMHAVFEPGWTWEKD
jgi:hypothetical protein